MAVIFSDDLIYIFRTSVNVNDQFVGESPDGNFGQFDIGGPIFVRFGNAIVGFQISDTAFALDSSLISVTADLPADGDPPFPPVWPYTWDTSLLYGREHLSQNIKMIRRDTFKFRVTITRNGSPVNITGATFTFSTKWNVRDAGTIFTCTAGDGISIIDATNGIIEITISSAKTSTLPAFRLILPYDLQMIESGGDVSTVLIGNLTIEPDIT